VQAAHTATARPERVHRPEPGGLDDAVVVLGVHLRRELTTGLTDASLHAAGVVGDDRAVGEVTDELLEARGAHRRAEDEQRAYVARGVGLTDVIRQPGAGDVEGVGGRRRHLGSFVRVLAILTGGLLGTHRSTSLRRGPPLPNRLVTSFAGLRDSIVHHRSRRARASGVRIRRGRVRPTGRSPRPSA
jgi:hypothetical protein